MMKHACVARGQINHAVAKAGLLGMTMTEAREWGRYNIRTNSICFGVVETPMTEVVRGENSSMVSWVNSGWTVGDAR
jgi:NAD(P)-dependent dehydrogenase (short-subunit alcohol dehydrogenase family)